MVSAAHKQTNKVLVLGSNSFAGGCLVKRLLAADIEVVGVSRSDQPHSIYLPYHGASGVFRFHAMDINRDMANLLSLIDEERPDAIVDFAGQGMVAESWQNPSQWYQTNVVAKSALHEHLKDCKFLRTYIRVSTPEVYGSTDEAVTEAARFNPSTPYAVSHAAIDMNLLAYHRQYDFPVQLARFANFYGPTQQLYRIIPRSIIYARMGKRLQLHGGGTAVRAFIYGDDIAEALMAMLNKGKPGETYHFSTEEFPTIYQVVERVASQLELPMGEWVDVAEERPGKDARYIMNSDKAARELGWRPQVRLEDGIAAVVEWVDHHLDVIKTRSLDYEHKA